jgi:spore germination cell wall hydrolase CwlJ-like protein
MKTHHPDYTGLFIGVAFGLCIMFILLSGFNKSEDSKVTYVEKKEHFFETIEEMKRTLCARDFQCLKMSEASVYEARGGGREAMEMVANVIKNRHKTSLWGDTIYDVVHDPKQFSYLKNLAKQSRPSEHDWEMALEISYDVLNGNVDDTTNGGLYYHSTKVKPSWANKLKYLFTRDDHRFYK